MRLCKIILILIWMSWTVCAQAQLPQELSSMPEQWQLTVDVIKSKAQVLIVKNNGLQDEYRQLRAQVENLRQSIADQQAKNDRASQFIKERRGHTDQELRITELNRIVRDKDQQVRKIERLLTALKDRQTAQDNNIQQLKMTISGIELRQQAEIQKAKSLGALPVLKDDGRMPELRKQLEDESKQEVLLENQLSALKVATQTQNLNVNAINNENRMLESHLDVLRLQKLKHEKKKLDNQSVDTNVRVYEELKKRKYQLESSISAYESRMDELRESSVLQLSWPMKKKKLIHEMVLVDARNNRIRDKVKDLREDIELLREQVARLERRLNFAKGKG